MTIHYLCNFCQQEDEVLIRDGVVQCAACGSTDVDSDEETDNTRESEDLSDGHMNDVRFGCFEDIGE